MKPSPTIADSMAYSQRCLLANGVAVVLALAASTVAHGLHWVALGFVFLGLHSFFVAARAVLRTATWDAFVSFAPALVTECLVVGGGMTAYYFSRIDSANS